MILISAAVAGKGRINESVFLVGALSADLYDTDPSAGNIWHAKLVPIIEFLILCAAPLAGSRGWWQKMEGQIRLSGAVACEFFDGLRRKRL